MSTATHRYRVKDTWQTPRNTATFQAAMSLNSAEIAERITELRRRHGNRSQRSTAARIGVGERTYQTWEGAEAVPRHENLERLAAYFGVSDSYILYGETARPEDPVVVSQTVDAGFVEFRGHVESIKTNADKNTRALLDRIEELEQNQEQIMQALLRLEERLPQFVTETDADVLERRAEQARRDPGQGHTGRGGA